MKNLIDVLKQKEREIENLQRDIDVLKAALRLCAEDEAEVALGESHTLKMPLGADVATANRPAPAMRKFP